MEETHAESGVGSMQFEIAVLGQTAKGIGPPSFLFFVFFLSHFLKN